MCTCIFYTTHTQSGGEEVNSELNSCVKLKETIPGVYFKQYLSVSNKVGLPLDCLLILSQEFMSLTVNASTPLLGKRKRTMPRVASEVHVCTDMGITRVGNPPPPPPPPGCIRG